MNRRLPWTVSLSFVIVAPLGAADWPMFGRDATRNAVSPEKDPPLDWHIAAEPKDDGKVAEVVKPARESRNIKWLARLGRPTTASPIVSGETIKPSIKAIYQL
jgi:hypothetical protein